MEILTWSSFKKELQNNAQSVLQFQYAANQWVDASYHITEIKQAFVTSVDCGGVMNAWTEIIVQLWEPTGQPATEAMKAGKALTIIDQVENTLPLKPNGVVKIEFGNAEFSARQMLPAAINISGNNLIVDLRVDTVQCKAIERGGSCGTNSGSDDCCTPAAKPKLPLTNLANKSSASCTPGSGCC